MALSGIALAPLPLSSITMGGLIVAGLTIWGLSAVLEQLNQLFGTADDDGFSVVELGLLVALLLVLFRR